MDYSKYDAAVKEIAPNLEMTAEFVPQSKSRNSGEPPCLNWRVSIHNGKPGPTLTTDYMQGIAHLPRYIQEDFNPRSIDGDTAVRLATESGYWNHYAPYNYSRGRAGGPSYGVVNIPPPSISEVLSCLLSDASALDYFDFESWASDYGYDEDSRSAEAIYRACLGIGLKLHSMLGDAVIDRLREALQDM